MFRHRYTQYNIKHCTNMYIIHNKQFAIQILVFRYSERSRLLHVKCSDIFEQCAHKLCKYIINDETLETLTSSTQKCVF